MSRSGTATAAQRGFTMLEMMVALAVFSLVMLMVAMAFSGGSNVAAVEATRNELQRSSQRALEVIASELRDSAPTRVTIFADGSGIRFDVPVDLDGNGTVLSPTGTLEFGFLQGGIPRQGAIIYRFIQNVRGGQPDVLSEAALRTGLNGDADQTDRFARGYLIRSTQVLGGPEMTSGPALTNPFITQPDGNWGGDLDGDGTNDPIFSFVDVNGAVVAPGPTNRIRINLRSLEVGSARFVHFVQAETCVWLRNR